MKSFFRENPTIAFGLGLPLLLVVAFLLISGIPALVVAPPEHDVLYATEYYNNSSYVQISVVNQKVQVAYQGNARNNRRPRLWRYSPKTGAVREIAILFPLDLDLSERGAVKSNKVSKITQIDVPDLDGLIVDSSSIAPDGYEFSTVRNGYSGGVFLGLFNSSRYRKEVVLTKNGRSVRLPNANNTVYSYNTHFIGWVVSQ